jgi:hypothetical protein
MRGEPEGRRLLQRSAAAPPVEGSILPSRPSKCEPRTAGPAAGPSTGTRTGGRADAAWKGSAPAGACGALRRRRRAQEARGTGCRGSGWRWAWWRGRARRRLSSLHWRRLGLPIGQAAARRSVGKTSEALRRSKRRESGGRAVEDIKPFNITTVQYVSRPSNEQDQCRLSSPSREGPTALGLAGFGPAASTIQPPSSLHHQHSTAGISPPTPHQLPPKTPSTSLHPLLRYNYHSHACFPLLLPNPITMREVICLNGMPPLEYARLDRLEGEKSILQILLIYCLLQSAKLAAKLPTLAGR